MIENFDFFYKRLTNKLWFRPLIFCVLSVGAALLAQVADHTFIVDYAPKIKKESLEDLLGTISSSMLVIAIFAVGSMLSAYSAASATATPRSFNLIVADDVSQNALSVYVGSFIFGIVASVAFKNGYYGQAGLFTLFVMTLLVFAIVILTFLKWVERISRLGRLGNTIKIIEEATRKSISKDLKLPYLGGIKAEDNYADGIPVFSTKIGYVQHINMEKLQELAVENEAVIVIHCRHGKYCSADLPLAYYQSLNEGLGTKDKEVIRNAFTIDTYRSFLDDPRFGLITLSEIASRALSPSINDPGTAIAIIGSHVRLFTLMLKDTTVQENRKVMYDRVQVPELQVSDMFEDAFRPIARDGAGNIEVMLRLQKGLVSIANVSSKSTKDLAVEQAKQAFERAEIAMKYPRDLLLLKNNVGF